MNRETAGKLIEENLTTILAWCMSKLYDRSEAEDLAGDIICAALDSAENLKNDYAFFGYFWRIANNVLVSRLRKKRHETVELDEAYMGVYFSAPEDDYINKEQIMLLRRELSLLSDKYRRATVLYYIYGKSCSEISSELDISAEMVRYYLFKTRKILKEGVSMTREFGAKSYDPHTFRPDFWGENGNNLWDLFQRKLPGNILLAAYDKPLTVSELGIELGVVAPYLEDEIEILCNHDFLTKVGDKYQTNIIIFTSEYEKAVDEKVSPIYNKATEVFNSQIEAALPELRELDFYGKDYDMNRMKWTFANIAMWHMFIDNDRAIKEKFGGTYPSLSDGTRGFRFGYDNNYDCILLNGIYNYDNREKTAFVSVVNYDAVEKCQSITWFGWSDTMSALADAALFKDADERNEAIPKLIADGLIFSDSEKLSPNYPVFGMELFNGKVKDLLTPAIDTAKNCIEEVCGIAAETLRNYTSKALADKCDCLARVHHSAGTMAVMIDTMVKKQMLTVPDEKMGLCMFAVNMR